MDSSFFGTPVYDFNFFLNFIILCNSVIIVVYLMSSCVNWTFFGTRGRFKRSFHSRLKMAHL
jgi:hypothetical protein